MKNHCRTVILNVVKNLIDRSFAVAQDDNNAQDDINAQGDNKPRVTLSEDYFR